MRSLEFWDTKPNRLDWRAKILQPLGALYAMATARRLARAPQVRCQVPVICIGNLNVGGTGKTPMTIALIQHLMARDLRPHVVLRGYGGRLAGPLTVRPHEHTSDEVGDEALLLAAYSAVGKLCYKWINYATGTVLRSSKLVFTMIISMFWLQRKYKAHQIVAAALLVVV